MTSLQRLAATVAAQAPALRPLRSPYVEPIHGSVRAAGEFTPSELAKDKAVVSGTYAIEQPFRPQKILAEALVVATHAADGQPDLLLRHELHASDDMKCFTLSDARFDGALIFPPRRHADFAISLACFSGYSLGLLPKALRQIDIQVSVGIGLWPLVQDRLPLPVGYDGNPKSLTVEVVLHFFGPRVAP